MKKLISFFTAIAIICSISVSAQTTKTWAGGTSTAWATAANWSPSGVPAATDNVVFNGTGTYQPILDANRTVANITVSGNTINLNAKVLTVTGTTSFTAGTVNSGTLLLTNTTTTFAGTTFGSKVRVTASNIYFNGSTFNASVRAIKTGTTANSSNGGNTFNDSLDIRDQSTGAITMCALYNDNYNGHLLISNTSTAVITIGGLGTGTLASTKKITIGVGGFTGGSLLFSKFTQSGTTSQSLTTTGGYIAFGTNCTWNGPVTFSGPDFRLNGSTFNKKFKGTLTSTLVPVSTGGNTFNDTLDLYMSGGISYLAYSAVDNYNGDVFLSSTGGSSGYGIGIGATGGGILATGKKIKVGSGGFSAGAIALNRFTQNGTTAQSITMTGSATMVFGTGTTFNGTVTLNVPDITITGTTFNSDFTLTKTSTSSNTSDGGNTFNGTTSFTTSSTGYLYLANVTADTYNGNVSFIQNSTGLIFPAVNGTNQFKGNINVTTTSAAITFGNSAGIVQFAGNIGQSVNRTGSNAVNITRILVNKTGNGVTLNTPINVSTSLTLTAGIISSTTTNFITLGSSATVSGTSNNSYINGAISKTGDKAFTFPVGKGGFYRPISIAAPTNAATVFKAEYFNVGQTLGSTADTSLANMSTCEYWTLTRSGSSDNVNVTLGWNSNSCNGARATNMRVASRSGSSWINLGNGSRTGNNVAGTVTTGTTPTVFTAFTLANKTCSYAATITPSGATTACSGVLTLTAKPSKYYLWSTNATAQVVTPTSTGTYTVTIRDTSGCKGSANQAVTIRPLPTVNAGADKVIFYGDTVQLTPSISGGTTPYIYDWTRGIGLSDSTIANPYAFTPYSSVEYTYVLKVTDNNGCVGKDTVKTRNSYQFYGCELVQNGCFGDLTGATPSSKDIFNGTINNWTAPSLGAFPLAPTNSPDLFSTSYSGNVRIPSPADNVLPFSGTVVLNIPSCSTKCAGIGKCLKFDDNSVIRNNDFIKQNITIEANKHYKSEMYVLRAPGCGQKSAIGMGFGNNTSGFINYNAGVAVVNKTQWTLISGEATPVSGTSSVSIGFPSSLVSTISPNPPAEIIADLEPFRNNYNDSRGELWAYYYIAGVSLKKQYNITNPYIDGDNNICENVSNYSLAFTGTNDELPAEMEFDWDLPSGATYTVDGSVLPLGTQINVNWGTNAVGGTITLTLSVCGESIGNPITLEVAPCCVKTYNIINANASDLDDILSGSGYVSQPGGVMTINTGFTSIASPGPEVIAIIGTLTIDVNTKFDNANIVFGRNSKIKFTGNHKLDVEDSWLHDCDGYLWDGIHASSGHKVYVTGSFIEDAKNAIVCSNKGDFRIINGSQFSKNYKDVVVSSRVTASPAIIYGSTFDGTTQPLPASPAISPTPLRTDVAFEISKIGGINIGQSGQTANTFIGQNVGIRSFISNTTLYNNKFQHYSILSGNSVQQGIAVFASGSYKFTNSINLIGVVGVTGNENLFDDCKFGVYTNSAVNSYIDGARFINGQSLSNAIRITNNVRNNVTVINSKTQGYTVGIFGSNNRLSKVVIDYNIISLSGVPDPMFGIGITWGENYSNIFNAPADVHITNNTITASRLGINTSRLSPATIDANTVKTSGTLYTWHWGTQYLDLKNWGINSNNNFLFSVSSNIVNGQLQSDRTEDIRFAQSPLAFVLCNTCNESGYTSGKGILYDQSKISLLAANKMRDSNHGLYLRNNSDIGQQGTPTAPNDNQWLGAFANKYVYTELTDGLFSPFNVRTGLPYAPPIPSGVGGDGNLINFVTGATGTPYPCVKSYAGFANKVRAFGYPVAEDTITYSSFGPAMRNLDRSTLYNIVLAYPDSFATDTALTDFVTAVATQPFAKFSSVSQKLGVDYFDSPNVLPDTVFAARDSVEFLTPQYTPTRSYLTSAKTLNSGVTPTCSADSIGKLVRGILIEGALTYDSLFADMLIKGNDTILNEMLLLPKLRYNNAQITSLINVALLCPLYYGPDVYAARNELMGIDDSLLFVFTNYQHPCEGDGTSALPRMAQDNDRKIENVKLYPNPTTGDLYIVNNSDEALQLDLYNSVGQLVLSSKIISGSNYLQLPDLANGLYFAKLSLGTNLVEVKKVIINK